MPLTLWNMMFSSQLSSALTPYFLSRACCRPHFRNELWSFSSAQIQLRTNNLFSLTILNAAIESSCATLTSLRITTDFLVQKEETVHLFKNSSKIKIYQIMNVPLSFPIGSLVISKQKLSSFEEESAEDRIPVVAENRAVFDFLSAIMPYDSLNLLPGPRDFFIFFVVVAGLIMRVQLIWRSRRSGWICLIYFSGRLKERIWRGVRWRWILM